jgi:cell division protein FtsW
MFAVVAEQGGMLAMTAIAGFYGLLIARGFLASWRATDNMGFLLGLGITGWIGYQAILNIAGAVGNLPLSGQGLPFMSLGGSDTVALLIAAGVLLNISRCGDDVLQESWTQLPLDWQPPSSYPSV